MIMRAASFSESGQSGSRLVLYSRGARGPKFRPQNAKGAEKNSMVPISLGPDFCQIYKKGRKGADLIRSLVFHKTIKISGTNFNLSLPFCIVNR
jgi:hypothetical protein